MSLRNATAAQPNVSLTQQLDAFARSLDSQVSQYEQAHPEQKPLVELFRDEAFFELNALRSLIAPVPPTKPAAPAVPTAPAAPVAATPTATPAAKTSSAKAGTAPQVPALDLHRGDHSAEVKQLQSALVKLGYMTQAQMNTGPGIYGPRTQAAVQKLQDAWHIRDGQGQFGPNTRAALRDQLAGKRPPSSGSSGSQGRSGATRADPGSFFLTQNRTKWNPGGSVNSNCGPTSLAMAALAFHKVPAGAKTNPEKLIEDVRRDMCNGVDNIHTGTTVGQVMDGARKLGMSSSRVSSMGSFNTALAQGKMVVVRGNPAAYGAHAGSHFILVTGRSANGGYVINDPVYTGRPGVVITPQQMANYFREGAAVS